MTTNDTERYKKLQRVQYMRKQKDSTTILMIVLILLGPAVWNQS